MLLLLPGHIGGCCAVGSSAARRSARRRRRSSRSVDAPDGRAWKSSRSNTALWVALFRTPAPAAAAAAPAAAVVPDCRSAMGTLALRGAAPRLLLDAAIGSRSNRRRWWRQKWWEQQRRTITKSPAGKRTRARRLPKKTNAIDQRRRLIAPPRPLATARPSTVLSGLAAAGGGTTGTQLHNQHKTDLMFIHTYPTTKALNHHNTYMRITTGAEPRPGALCDQGDAPPPGRLAAGVQRTRRGVGLPP